MEVFGEININFIWGEQKEGERGDIKGEAQNEGYFCKIPIIKQDTNFISQTVGRDKLLITTTTISMPQTYMERLSSEFEQSFLVKNNFPYF